MIEAVRGRRLRGQLIYIVLMMIFLFWRLLPLSPGQIIWPGPDLALCLTFAWVLRRPDDVPVLIIAALFFIEDIVLLRPLGLFTALVVMATEAARVREPRWRELSFVIEWLRVALLIAMLMLANRILLIVFVLPAPPLGQMILQFLATAAAYPIVVALARWPLGVKRALPVDGDR
ncbi:rod shape-determining protein MreD [Paracoccus sulfuroxidans]|uniref:Rod shape-determining protein MreD n=1 Tax=Paracoccus sulfuroxidans TaxID=384678 RepID=A0A562P0M1_9RHOB|nr:rod shape-determining protein MreD [Paracoccus sulfuroxidans]TWI38042.1 rod shape-determining protein MreD [Paracoccus sulfuroxidans]